LDGFRSSTVASAPARIGETPLFQVTSREPGPGALVRGIASRDLEIPIERFGSKTIVLRQLYRALFGDPWVIMSVVRTLSVFGFSVLGFKVSQKPKTQNLKTKTLKRQESSSQR